MTNLEVGEIVMCTVEKIAGTLIFVKIDRNGQGSITLSEIAPGRIRNLRDYVFPKKRIVCKVLKIAGERIELSLRRVTPKEQKEIREQYKIEKGYVSVLRTILKEKEKEITEEIQKTEKVYDFLEAAKTNPKELEKIAGKEDAKKILEILSTQKKKEISLRREFELHGSSSNGLEIIKGVLIEIKKAKIKYISAGKYLIKSTAENIKEADKIIKEALESIEKQAKKQSLEFKIKEK
jgi:translation initiation factor 2 alpha subunit (eIF-2alpha)